MKKIKKKNNKRTLLLVIIVLIIGINLGYSALSASLKINSTAGVANTTWDIHFENAAATSISNITPTTSPSAQPSAKKVTLTYNITLTKPGDIYEFTVNVKNGGTLDAMLSSFTNQFKIGSGSWQNVSASTLPNYLLYSVTYSDGVSLKAKDKLQAGSSETLKVHIEFNKDVSTTDLTNASGKTIYFTLSLNYNQTDGTEFASHNFVYTTSTTSCNIGSTIPSGVTTTTTVPNATYWIKHNLDKDGKITDSFAEFKVTSSHVSSNPGMVAGTYSLKGADKAFYADNYNKLKTAFGYDSYPGRCYLYQGSIYCNNSDFSVEQSAAATGYVGCDEDTPECEVNPDGSSHCY